MKTPGQAQLELQKHLIREISPKNIFLRAAFQKLLPVIIESVITWLRLNKLVQ